MKHKLPFFARVSMVIIVLLIAMPIYGRMTPDECYRTFVYEVDRALDQQDRDITRCAGNIYCASEAHQSFNKSADIASGRYCACVLWCL